MVPQFLALGHATYDRLPDGRFVPGGTVRYATGVAARLGLAAAIVTAGTPAALLPDHEGVQTVLVPSPAVTTFENRYDAHRRSQWLHALASPLVLAHLPHAWYATRLVHLAPVAHELDLALITAFPEALIVVTPQGWMRTWTEPLPALVHPCRWLPSPALLRRINLLVVSIEDVAGDEALVASYAHHCPLVVVTRGALGATLYQHGVSHPIAACPAQEYDPTGAGDVFAAAMLVRLAETGDPLAAAQFASAAAALVVEGRGLGNLTNRDAVLARL